MGPLPVPATLMEVVGVRLVDRQVEVQVLHVKLPLFADVSIEARSFPEHLVTARSVSSANRPIGTPSSRSSECLLPMVYDLHRS